MPVFRTFSYNATLLQNRLRNRTCNILPNHLEIITSVFIPYKDFDLEDFPTVTIQDIMNAQAPVCIENGRMCPNARHHRKDIISVNEDAVEFKKDNGSIHHSQL